MHDIQTLTHHPVRWSPLLLLLLATTFGAGHAAAGESHGRSRADLAMEDFLLHGSILEIEDVGRGITEPKRLTLEHDGVRRRAIFKSIDAVTKGLPDSDPRERRFANRSPADRYAYEVAAYRLDRLAGIGLVPVTVVRNVGGTVGSVQLWIEGVTTLHDAVQDSELQIQNFDLVVERLGLTYVLDALIYNVDRNYGDILVDFEHDVFYSIDHSRSFRLSSKPPNRRDTDLQSIPEHVDQRLRAFDLETLRALVGDLLDDSQVRAVIKRRNRLVKMLDKRAA